MKKIIAIIFIGLFLGCGCNKEEDPSLKLENGVITKKPFIWWNKEEEHDQSIESVGLIYNGSFIAESHQGGKSFIALLDAETGKIKWKWNEYLRETDGGFLDYFSYHNLLSFQSGPRSYCINLENGKTQWNKIWGQPMYVRVGGIKNQCFILQDYPDNGDQYPGFYILDLQTGNIKEKIIPKYLNTINRNVSGELGRIITAKSFNQNSTDYIVITYCESINEKNCIPLISLFNYTENKWVYEYKKITNLESYALPCVDIQNNKIYHDGASHVFCNDLWTGDSIWTQEFKGNFLFGSCTYDQGTLYCAAEGDGYYALDAETGAIKWKGERAPGTSSRMVVLNGVLYYINGGDGRLWALDLATGKTLWRLKSPDGYSFKREINVMQGDGERKRYVLTSTWHGACAYEAEQ